MKTALSENIHAVIVLVSFTVSLAAYVLLAVFEPAAATPLLPIVLALGGGSAAIAGTKLK